MKNEFSSLIEENNEAQLSLLSNEDSLTLANHSIIEEKYLLIPHYFKIQKYLKKNNDDFNNFFDKNEDVIKVFKKLLVLFKEEKFKHLLIKKNWKIFKPNDSYQFSSDKIEYMFEHNEIKKKIFKIYQGLFKILKSKDDIFIEIEELSSDEEEVENNV